MAASRTAEYVALFRAIESARPAGKRLFSDPFAAGFLDPGFIAVAALSGLPGLRSLIPRYIDRRWPGARASAVVRTGMIDDAVSEGLRSGAAQMAILGAGYDSRAMRLPEARNARVFELDQPDTQERKKSRLEKMNHGLPDNVVYVPFDLEEEGVGAPLERAGFVSGRKTVVIWEGVLSYLTPEAVDATLAWVSGECDAGSRLVFTYVDVALFGSADGASTELPWSAKVAEVGEPFNYGLDPATLDQFLSSRGLELDWDLSTAEGLGGESAPDFFRVAQATVSAR